MARRHSPGDWLLAAEASLALLTAHAVLGMLPFAWVAASLSARGREDAPAGLPRRVGWAVETAARRLPLRLTCLRQAFAAAWMLQRRGLAPRLHYGVAREANGVFIAHAWLEIADEPVIGHQAAAFTLLASFPP